jgi:hypothetical protein
MYAKMEHQRLNFVRRNQKKLRSDLYSNLQDAANADDCDTSTLGKKVILPSSFIGSPRHLVQLYQDSMSIVRKHGKPDLFVTFTCNQPGLKFKESFSSIKQQMTDLTFVLECLTSNRRLS